LMRWKEAVEMYSKAIGLDPDYESAIRYRGIVLKSLNRREEAILDFRKALSIKATEENFYNLILSLCETGNLKEAEDLMKTAFKSFPVYDKYIDPYVNLLIDEKDYDSAFKLNELLIANKPEEINYMLNKGNIYFYQKKYAEARSCYEHVIKSNENFSMGYNNLAAIEQRTGNMQNSISLLNKAIELDLKNDVAFVNCAYAYIKLGDFASAKSDLEAALKINSLNGDAYAYQGFIELLQNKNEENFFSLLKTSISQLYPYQLEDELEQESILQPYKNDMRMKTLLEYWKNSRGKKQLN
jgi:tetratricopeptide (TPR) repeat protein